MEAEIREQIAAWMEKAEFFLIGIGKELGAAVCEEEKLKQAYQALEKIVNGKPYFVVTENEDEIIFSSPLLDFFIAAPFAPESRKQSGEEQWNSYLNWLTATLNHRLCILEFGVGFEQPQVIRWPFEKTAAFHLKSILIRINEVLPQLPKDLGERGLSIKQNAVDFLLEYEHEKEKINDSDH